MNILIKIISISGLAFLTSCMPKNQLEIYEENRELILKNSTNVSLNYYKNPLLYHIDVAEYSSGSGRAFKSLMLVLTDSNNRKYMLCGSRYRPPYDKDQLTYLEFKKKSVLIFKLQDPIYYHYCNKLKAPLFWQMLYVEVEPIYSGSGPIAKYRILYQSNKIKLANDLNLESVNSADSTGNGGSEVIFSN